ncbi:MAG TPA: glycoside hydrolase family 25 protein [Flavisolibacter sp.]|nr:glycoside hydrolase family 25 protein [Flavisolibacter sp.]
MAKRKSTETLRIFLWITAIAAALFLGYLFLLWSRVKEPTFIRYKEFGISIPTQYEIHGIDVSRYQSTIAWEAVKEMRVKNIQLGFAFMKATEGNDLVDPFFKRNWKKAKSAGLVRGAYHFFNPKKDGKVQAQNFFEHVKLESGDLPPVLDIEKAFGMSGAKLQQEIRKWLDAMEAAYGVKPIIYTYVTFYERYLKGSFDDYPLWIAHYYQADNPRISRRWHFWQHSEEGRVNGIIAKVDFNVFNGDSAAFKALLLP